ncbi:Cell cycle checkpoint control protein rad9b [Halocaridina rubra]|uniref:Cell cycle checkpoint control protein RAD9A n=1 Tax=Halocaridina rubra TaxID=373956 RepID=A0AAN8WSE7_HALRR
MKCVIGGPIVKVFGRAIHSLSRVGDELYVEPGPHGVSFRAVSFSKAAFGTYEFSVDYFSQYDSGMTVGQQTGNESVKCKVAIKAMLNVFKNVNQLNRKVEKCKLTLDGEAATFIIQFICRYGVVKTFNLPFIECETLQAVYDKSACTNYILSEPNVLCDVLNNFQADQSEVTLFVTKEQVIFKSYLDDAVDQTKAVSTSVGMKRGEFNEYSIRDEGEVTFCLKELRALLGWSDPCCAAVAFHFIGPGSPIIFVSSDENLNIEAVFVLATLSKPSDSQIPKLTSNEVSPKIKTHNVSSSSEGDFQVRKRKKLSSGEDMQRCPIVLSESNTPGRLREERASATVISTTMEDSSFENNHDKIAVESPSALHPPKTKILNGNTSFSRPSSVSDKRHSDVASAVGEVHNKSGSSRNVFQVRTPEFYEEEPVDAVPGTPPQQNLAHYLFKRCFESTFDPNSIPGSDIIYAADSDEDQS